MSSKREIIEQARTIFEAAVEAGTAESYLLGELKRAGVKVDWKGSIEFEAKNKGRWTDSSKADWELALETVTRLKAAGDRVRAEMDAMFGEGE